MDKSEVNSIETFLQQQALLRAVFGTIRDAVIATDTEGKVTFLNLAAETMTGCSMQEAKGKPLESVFQIINDETRQILESPASHALREGRTGNIENHALVVSKNGGECPIEHTASPIRTAKGEVEGVVLVFRDVSELKRHESLRQEALACTEGIIATMPTPFLVLDRTLRIESANEAFYKTFHLSPKETLGQFLHKVGHGQFEIPALRSLLKNVMNLNQSFHDFEVEHDHPQRGRKRLVLNARRMSLSGEKSGKLFLAIEDITDRRSDERTIHVSEVRYRRLFESAKDGILILDEETGQITDVNPFMGELLGYSQPQFLGKQLWEIGLFSDKIANEAAFASLKRVGYIRYEHLPLETSRGRRVEVEIIANVYREATQSVIQCNIRDITERSRLEKRLEMQALALADLHRRKDEFLAMLSHELRNPLAPIANAAYLLRLRSGDDPVRGQAITIIERQVSQLTRLVDDLMENSRISNGRVQLRLDRVALGGIVERAVESVRPLIDQRKHLLTVSLPPQTVWLNADAARMEQVLVNLLTNAAKYTDEGGRIDLSVSQEKHECVVRLRDSGVGIAPDILPHIFELYTQAEHSLDRSHGGLGIGLTLVQRLVEMHRGTVEATSTLGQGSEFTVRLPLLAPPTSQPDLVKPAPAAATARTLRVLVVDDNVDSAASLAMLLRAQGHEAVTAHDGPSALAAAIDFRPHVALLDIGLPKMDGYAVAKTMRQQPGLEHVVLVAVTGYGAASDLQLSRDAGFDHHILKPADIAKVSEILSAVTVGLN